MADASLADLGGWIGRSRTVEDEITRPALRRIAALLDRDDVFVQGAALPPHWYAAFFPDIVPQRGLGADGHPERGDFLPPVPLPRRMLAGRRVRFVDTLRVGDIAEKRSEIVSITPKSGRSGNLVFVTVRHTISVDGVVVITEDQDVVYREAVAGSIAPPSERAPVPPPAWSDVVTPTTALLFRYSSVTFNTHRIHYDADYARAVEGYPGLVVNGGLTLLLLLETAIHQLGATPSALEVRNARPLFVANPVTLAGTEITGGRALAWAADASGMLAVSAALSFA